MTPIKMKDGQFAFPIRSKADMADAQARGCVIEFTACGCAYDLPSHEKDGSAGWIEDHFPETTCDYPLIDGGRRARGVSGTASPAVEAKPTLWQRIKGWFA